MRYSVTRTCVMLVAAAGLAVAGQPAVAKDTAKGKWSQDKARGYCDAKDGSDYFSTSRGDFYGCSYEGGGGLMCDKNGCVESDGNLDDGQEPLERRAAPEWLGLLGLAGLAGLLGLRGSGRRGTEPVR